MDLLLIALLMLLGGGLVALLGYSNSGESAELIAFTATLGAIIGTLTGYGLLTVIRSTTNRRRIARPRVRDTTAPRYPRSFRSRLARFTGQREQDVLREDDAVFQSRMPLRVAVDAIRRIPPKSATVIRQILMAIRKILSK